MDRPPGGLLTSTTGSYARPSWLFAGLTAAERGELGSADVAELLDDAVDLAIREQEGAGIDILTDGEMRRSGFFTASFYDHLTGIRSLPPARLVGPGSHDQQHRFEVVEPITAPAGLGVVAEYVYARARTARPLKMTIPGPFTLSGRLTSGPGQVYPDRLAAASAFVPILNAELRAMAAADVSFVQIDEPSPAIHPELQADFAGLLNAALDGVEGMRVAVHLCFGNYLGRPLAKRTYRPVLDSMLAFHADELVLEFANREMTELDLLTDIAPHRDLAIGVVDVKSSYVETAEDVAQRIDLVLAAGVPAERLTLVPDCGFSQTVRSVARAKLRALVGGTRLVIGRD
jgi:5-methyltetrahydropteroyltriglutamate--homocysteine methyltransferase